MPEEHKYVLTYKEVSNNYHHGFLEGFFIYTNLASTHEAKFRIL